MSFVRRNRASVLAAVVIAALVALPRGSGTVLAGDPDVNGALTQQHQMEQQLSQQRAALASLVKAQASLGNDLERISGDLAAVGVAIDDAESRLRALSLELQDSRRQLETYRSQIANLATSLGTVEAQIGTSTAQLNQREALLQDHLRAAYRESQVSMLEVILSSQSFSQTAAVLGDMLTLSDGDKQLADEIRTAREQLRIRETTLREGRTTLASLEADAATRSATLASQQRELDAAQTALAEKKAALEKLRAAEQSQLMSAQTDAEAYRQKIAEQEAALIGQAELVAQLKEQADKLDVAYHGRFAWPLIGPFVVTQEFGHTAFETFHSGIDLAYTSPMCGGPIYAAADGVVLADGRPNLAYGDTAIGVIIGHSQRLQTWYWHLSREVVSVGQSVRAGDIIGYEGATGWATGCHLHFQVMFDGQPVNPRGYLP
jgi:murein DD-endopeptidase MepM/ murein hydrolase activator NlpD